MKAQVEIVILLPPLCLIYHNTNNPCPPFLFVLPCFPRANYGHRIYPQTAVVFVILSLFLICMGPQL